MKVLKIAFSTKTLTPVLHCSKRSLLLRMQYDFINWKKSGQRLWSSMVWDSAVQTQKLRDTVLTNHIWEIILPEEFVIKIEIEQHQRP